MSPSIVLRHADDMTCRTIRFSEIAVPDSEGLGRLFQRELLATSESGALGDFDGFAECSVI